MASSPSSLSLSFFFQRHAPQAATSLVVGLQRAPPRHRLPPAARARRPARSARTGVAKPCPARDGAAAGRGTVWRQRAGDRAARRAEEGCAVFFFWHSAIEFRFRSVCMERHRMLPASGRRKKKTERRSSTRGKSDDDRRHRFFSFSSSASKTSRPRPLSLSRASSSSLPSPPPPLFSQNSHARTHTHQAPPSWSP